MSAARPVPSLAIVGGGIAGLTLALNLINRSKSASCPQPKYTVTIYESAHAFAEIGAGVSFGPNASRAMKAIGPEVYAAFERTQTRNQFESKQDVWFDFRFGESIDGRYKVSGEEGADANGELIATVKCPGGQRGVKRSDFLDELIKHVPEGVAKFGRRVTHYTESANGKVTLHFREGDDEIHDAVIGCDGIKSNIRKALLSETSKPENAHATFSGKFCYRGLIPMDEAVSLLGEEMAKNAQMYLGRHGHILTFAIEKGKLMNVVAFASAKEWHDDRWVVEANHDQMKADFEGWSPTVTKIISLMRKNDIWALFNHPPAPTYVSKRGRVCILGDAAHATTPHKGSGAGMAIEDALVMGQLVSEALAGDNVDAGRAIPAAFRAFDATRRERTLRLVEDSRETGQLYDLEHPAFGTDKDKIRETLLTRMNWVWDMDLDAEVTRSLEKLRNIEQPARP
ncbi:mannitol 1-phosphate dehydrogenase [Diaporthe helianthi]|uniref:Mannitol 1-phosphate dehydrogenase n=1 Tax=Diaporthe helianthi TaxID=158607 RepID=A0A2P5HQC3_DIAHE|nr:mannitol 1-phosphate dehydrogenase [Diaporthe helianthi]